MRSFDSKHLSMFAAQDAKALLSIFRACSVFLNNPQHTPGLHPTPDIPNLLITTWHAEFTPKPWHPERSRGISFSYPKIKNLNNLKFPTKKWCWILPASLLYYFISFFLFRVSINNKLAKKTINARGRI